MRVLSVKASTPYEVVISEDYSLLAEKLKGVVKGKIAVVFDENTARIFAEKVKVWLADFSYEQIVIKAGEESKSKECYFKLLSFLAERNFTRKDAVLAFGGGVVGELCGFVSATYMRGITYLSCPTTLLSCVDSSIGGKTAINLPEGKNLVGAFYQPSLVYISLSVMETLPRKEVECGFGEVVKYAFLDKTVAYDDIKGGITEELILKCLKIKKKFVEEDEFDKGERAKLNLGHTVGHAVESLSRYEFSHGLCVAKGMDKIIDISCKYYGYGEEERAKMKQLLNVYPFDLTVDFTTEQLLSKIKIDKKSESSAVSLILVKDIGNTEVVKISLEKLKELL